MLSMILVTIKTAVEAAKEAKAEVEHSVEVQGCLVYTVGGPHTIAEFGKLAKELDAMGVDSICIKDMSGLLKHMMLMNSLKN